MKLVRKQFYITPEQDVKLKRLAAERGVTEAELVRAALDALGEVTYDRHALASGSLREAAVMERYVTDDAGRLDNLIQALDQQSADEAWQRELGFLESLRDRTIEGNEGESWRFDREEVYEERLAKILRRH